MLLNAYVLDVQTLMMTLGQEVKGRQNRTPVGASWGPSALCDSLEASHTALGVGYQINDRLNR